MSETFIERLSLAGATSATTAASLSGYKHLRIVGMTRSTRAGFDNSALWVRFNGDAGTNYQFERISGQSTGVTGLFASGQLGLYAEMPAATSAAGLAGVFEVHVPFYDQTTFQKHGTMRVGDHVNSSTTGHRIRLHGWAWANTAAITSITVADGNSQIFASGSLVDIYGIG